MKLVCFGARGSEKPGVIDARGAMRDLSVVVPDIDARTLSPAALARLREIDHATLPAAPAVVRLGACVGSIANLVCIGLNYRITRRKPTRRSHRNPSYSTSAPALRLALTTR